MDHGTNFGPPIEPLDAAAAKPTPHPPVWTGDHSPKHITSSIRGMGSEPGGLRPYLRVVPATCCLICETLEQRGALAAHRRPPRQADLQTAIHLCGDKRGAKWGHGQIFSCIPKHPGTVSTHTCRNVVPCQSKRRQCQVCETHSPSQPAEPLMPTPPPQSPFQQVATDLFQLEGNTYIAYADRLTGWLEVDHLSSGATTTRLLTSFGRWFTKFFIPEELLCDGGTNLQPHQSQGKEILQRLVRQSVKLLCPLCLVKRARRSSRQIGKEASMGQLNSWRLPRHRWHC